MTAPTTLSQSLTGNWALDPAHSRIGFVARHAMITKVRGSFGEFEGTATLDEANPAGSSAEVTLQVASITTGQEQRDEHLRSADFFDAATYPTITFRATGVEPRGSEYLVTGDLTIRDVTKPVTVTFEPTGVEKDPFGNTRAGFEGHAEVNRKDWGLTWNAALESGGLLVSEKIKLEFDIAVIKTA